MLRTKRRLLMRTSRLLVTTGTAACCLVPKLPNIKRHLYTPTDEAFAVEGVYSANGKNKNEMDAVREKEKKRGKKNAQ